MLYTCITLLINKRCMLLLNILFHGYFLYLPNEILLY